MQAATAADFAAHLQMPHIPLPLETPLPPSSYDFTAQGAFHLPHALHGPQAHPLFEGVLAMHQVLGHELNFNWPDIAACAQPSPLAYAQPAQQQPYPADPGVEPVPYGQWSPPPGSILDSTPSPAEYSHPSTPEHHQLQPEPLIESPVSEDFPSAIVPPPSQTSSFAIFPLVVSGTKTHEHTVAFQADRTKAEKSSSKLDPHAADFIREKLGELRWAIFSSRLAERRTSSHKPKRSDSSTVPLASKPLDVFSSDKAVGASALDFLVKVEVVKSVLRTYVPHPYNPLKTLSHSYLMAPSGQVTLSRSTILALSGWSNTQFSYWARRSEAISVLAPHDTRLRTVAIALERRLHAAGLFESDIHPPSPSSSHTTSATLEFEALSRELNMDPDDWVRTYVTGKGLDVIIDEVKKRSGVSPFLRGKHSSLDPFGAASGDAEGEHGKRAVVYMPTFQAEKYVHEVPEVDPNALSGMVSASAARVGKRKASSPPPREGSVSDESWASVASEVSAEDVMVKLSDSRPHSLTPPLLFPEEVILPPLPLSVGRPASPSPSDVHSQAHAQAHSQYFDAVEAMRAQAIALADPSSFASHRAAAGGKKRRLAPAPPSAHVPGVPVLEPPRLYNNHLETG